MNAATAMAIGAIAAEAERPGIIAAGEQLAHSLTAASGADRPVRLRIASHRDPDIPPGVALVISLQEDATSGGSIEQAAERWRARIARYRAAGHERILLCNLFRHVEAPGSAGVTVERIRRLNLLAVELSRELGIEIVDIDRLLALCGGRTIGADYRCGSAAAARLVGHAIAAAILDGELGAGLDAATQERASAAHGGVRNVGPLLQRHIHARPHP